MKKSSILSGLLMFAFVVAGFGVIAPEQALADSNGNAYGRNSFPGNSLYGRSHNPHFETKFNWGGFGFTNFDDFVEHMQEYLADWRANKVADTEGVAFDIDTRTARDITEDSALLRGLIDHSEAEYVHVWFEYGTDSGSLDENTDTVRIDDGEDRDFDETISDLDAGERYYYRAVGEDSEDVTNHGKIFNFTTEEENSEGVPDATTLSADRIDHETVELNGEVDMNDFNNGIVFFIYGTDEGLLEDVEENFDTYSEIDDTNLQKIHMDGDLDEESPYSHEVTDLDEETVYYYAIGVEYEDGEDTLEVGMVKEFTLEVIEDEEPTTITERPTEVDADSAELRGSVEMNDFDDGKVFFIYGKNATILYAIENEYQTYEAITGDLEKVEVDGNLNGEESYTELIESLDSGEYYFYAIGVEYKNAENDSVLAIGGMRSFFTE